VAPRRHPKNLDADQVPGRPPSISTPALRALPEPVPCTFLFGVIRSIPDDPDGNAAFDTDVSD